WACWPAPWARACEAARERENDDNPAADPPADARAPGRAGGFTMDLRTATARPTLAAAEVADLRAAGVLIEDPRRQRPRYFDGRFLAARDLIRDQQYFLSREADLGQAAGSGVASGLFVQEDDAPQTLRVLAGHGLTPGGELV